MTNPFTWSFHSAGNIVFGCGSVSQVGTFAHKYTARKVLLVTDELLAASGIINKVIESLLSSDFSKLLQPMVRKY